MGITSPLSKLMNRCKGALYPAPLLLHNLLLGHTIVWKRSIAPRSLFLLLMAILASCSKESSHQWEFEEVRTIRPEFNGGRLILAPDTDYSNLELEIVRSSSGIRFYINLLLFQAYPWPQDPTLTTLTIQFDEQEPWVIHPYLLEGGQRLLLPGEIADTLIEALLQCQSFTIQIGRSQVNVSPTHFSEDYKALLDIPIKEKY